MSPAWLLLAAFPLMAAHVAVEACWDWWVNR